MRGKRKPESPLKSEPSPKIRRLSTPPVVRRATARGQVEGASPPSSIPALLTKENLRQLENMTNSRGPKSLNTIGSTAKTGTDSDAKSRLSTTDQEFESKFRENGGIDVLDSRKHPPANEDEIIKFLNGGRDSASPTPSQHDRFVRGLKRAANERDIEALYSGRVLKDTNKVPDLEDLDYGANIDKQWVAYPKDVGFNNGLAAPKPDLTEGYLQKAFPPTIKQLGGSATLVKNDPQFVGLPHFVAEFKDFGKSVRQCEVQAGYDGAAMVYARNNALASMEQSDPPRRASPMSMASDGRTWRTYVHYAHENDATKRLDYYQYQVAFGDMTKDEDLRRGHRTLRNAQDWGRKESTDLRDRLQQYYANGHQLVASAKAGPASSYPAAGTSSKQGSVPSSGDSPAPPRAPSSRLSDAAVSCAKKAAPRPPPSGSSSTSSKRDGKQRVPSDGKAMPPPPSTSSRASSKRDERHRPPTGAQGGNSRPSSSTSGASRPETPRSSTASVASGERDRTRRHDRLPVDGERAQGRPVEDRDRDRYRGHQSEDQEPARGRDREQGRYRDYRDRTSGDDIAPVPRRRSDSPQDKARLLRPQGKDKIDRGRATSGDRRVDRYESGSAGSGSSTSTSTRVSAKPPAVPAVKVKSGMFSNNKPVKKPQGND